MADHQGPSGSLTLMDKCIIVAVADNLAIGRGNDMPWHISEDLKYFKRVTSGHPVIMGRRTFESIGRPLPKRTNIVVTRGCELPEGVIQVPDLASAYAEAAKVVADDAEPRCFITGGGQLYKTAIDGVDHMYITHIHTTINDAEVFFPEIDLEKWEVESRSEVMKDGESGLEFEFVVYRRR